MPIEGTYGWKKGSRMEGYNEGREGEGGMRCTGSEEGYKGDGIQ